ncbi:MAG: GTP-binding protein EngB [Euryarchaeota archaeon]|nr:GTP-binding protein EngB [Euryarchaeota archaeon]
MKNKIAFVGRSNVGKSSTIRALTGAALKVGKRPGVTLKSLEIPYGNFKIVDMPGFGFMQGVSKRRQEEIKDFIVRYLEKHEDILFAVQVTDAKAFAEIAKRHQARGEIPVEIEMFHFLQELRLNPILAANKIDKVAKSERGEKLNEICALLGLPTPNNVIVPFSAKTKEGLEDLKKLIRERIK